MSELSLHSVEFDDALDVDRAIIASERIAAEESLSEYIKQAWPIIEPDTAYLHNWHIDAISEHLMACTQGEITRLLINIPPRYMKSIAVSVMWPTWIWGPQGRPGERWIFASYGSGSGQNPAVRDSVKRRTLMRSEWYQQRWGDQVSFATDQDIKTYYENTRHGSMFSTTMGSGGLGFGGNFIVLDDPQNTQNVNSSAERQATIDFFTQTLSRRLDDKRKGVIVIVMQRLAVDDMSGFVEKMGGWEHLKLPAQAHERETVVYPVSKKVHRREPGDLLWPEREGPAEIADAKRMLGERGYAGQYDQEPVPLGGAVFKSDWLRYYKSLPPIHQIIFSYDGAHKTGRENDYSVFTVWGIGEDHRIYLLDVWREKEELPTLIRLMAALIIYWRRAAKHWNATVSKILVEDASSGASLIQAFKEPVRIDDKVRVILRQRLSYKGEMPDELHPRVSPPIVPIKVDKDKLSRAEAVTPMFERGDVWLPDPNEFDAPWLGDYENELLSFTGVNDVHDDQVDATTQLLNHVRGLGSFSVVNYWREKAHEAKMIQGRVCTSCRRSIDLQSEPYRRNGEFFLHVKCPGSDAAAA